MRRKGKGEKGKRMQVQGKANNGLAGQIWDRNENRMH